MWSYEPYMGLKMTKNRSENGEKLPFSQLKVKKSHFKWPFSDVFGII